jgi:hypothetical protein
MTRPTLDVTRRYGFYLSVGLGLFNVVVNGVLMAVGGSVPLAGLMMIAGALVAFATMSYETTFRVNLARAQAKRDKAKVDLDMAERMLHALEHADQIVMDTRHRQERGPAH